MTQTIRWVKSFESDVGSILIYRAPSSDGTYSLITTIGAKDTSGDWVGSYNDAGGTIDSWYKIQTWDGTGSSDFSDPISGEFWYLMAEIEDVKDELRLTSLSDISDKEIYIAIVDADDWIYTEYGKPVSKTYTYFYSGSYTYSFVKDEENIYRVDEVDYEDGSGKIRSIGTGSFSINEREGELTFSDTAFVDENAGRRLNFEYVPKAYHLLCKYKAALDIAEANLVTDGDKAAKTTVNRLQKKFDTIYNSLKPTGAYNATVLADNGINKSQPNYVDQEFKVD